MEALSLITNAKAKLHLCNRQLQPTTLCLEEIVNNNSELNTAPPYSYLALLVHTRLYTSSGYIFIQVSSERLAEIKHGQTHLSQQ